MSSLRHLRLLAILAPLALAANGCSASSAADASDETASAASASSEVRVTTGNMTVWLDAVATPSYRDGSSLVVKVRGRTSLPITDAFSWVPDDPFGTTTVTGPKAFEISLEGGSELNSILSGLPLFVRLTQTNASGQALRSHSLSVELAPRFARFTGDRRIFVDTPIKPVYFKDGRSDLRYRGTASASGATALNVYTDDDSDPEVATTGAGRFRFDWEYGAFALAFDYPRDPVHFGATFAGRTARKTAAIELAVANVRITTKDVETTWPSPTCKRATWGCIHAQAAGTVDFAACGTYREVSRCMSTDACEMAPGGTLPFALADKDASALVDAVAAAHAGCPRNAGSWCSVDAATAFTFPWCTATAPTLDVVAADAVARTDRDGVFDARHGRTVDRAELLATSAFRGGLLEAIDAFAGDVAVEAKLFTSEESCHNCHQFRTKYVLFYPATRVIVVIDGGNGYDS